MESKTKSLDLLLWGVVLFWGANYVVGKWGMLGFDPVTFNLIRFLGATPVLFLMLYLLERDLRVKVRDLPELALLGLVGITVYQTVFMSAVKYATATNASLLLAASPVFTAIFAKLTGQEKMGRQGWLGSGMAFIGVLLVLMFSSNKLVFGYEVWRGNLYGILASSIWGLYPIVAYRPLQKYSALKAITYSALFGTLFFIVIGVKAFLATSLPNVPMVSWGSLLFSIGPVTVFGLVTWYYGISKVGANRVMAYMYAVPAVAVITAFIMLGERLHVLQVIGAVVIFLGINLIRKDKDKQKLGLDSHKAIRNDVQFSNPTQADIESTYQLFETSIPDAFEKEGLGFLQEDISREIEHKKHLFDASLALPHSDIYFLIAKLDETVVGTISFGPCGEDIKKCTDNQLNSIGELGSLYILPRYQDQGLGSALINAMVTHLYRQGINQFCLDSGYKRAQKRWLRKFGAPYKVVKDYWGPDSNHMVWLCKVSDLS